MARRGFFVVTIDYTAGGEWGLGVRCWGLGARGLVRAVAAIRQRMGADKRMARLGGSLVFHPSWI